MGSITPILDTLLPQVLGRAGDVARLGTRAANGPLSALRPVSDDTGIAARHRAAGPSAQSAGSGAIGAAGAARGRAAPASADPSTSQATGLPGGVPVDASAELHLSRAAHALARLLGQVETSRQSTAVRAEQPLAKADSPRPSALAAALDAAVTTSGLFYESHLAAWVRGQWPRARLVGEPQARWPTDADTNQGAGGHGASPASGAASVDPRMALLVRQQIDLLAGGVFQWQGEAWPEAPMRWSIEPDDEHPAETEGESVRAATTALSLTLAGIGVFEARLRVAGDSVSVAAWVEQGAGRDLIAADLDTLRRRLGAAGFDRPRVDLIAEADE